jgi:glutathione S-transferase
MTFKLNDIYWLEMVPVRDRLLFLRHKERKFGVGCLDRWSQEKKYLLEELTRRLLPFDEMLVGHSFLLEDRPRFVDFDLYGMLGNFLYSGHYRLPPGHVRLKQWHRRMGKIKIKDIAREKLRS